MKMMMARFSDVYRQEGFLPWLQAQEPDLSVLEGRDVEGCCCYCDAEAQALIEARFPQPLPPVRWIDSGDYHYLSCLLALRETQPFHLLLLDHHPDDQPPSFDGVLSCGGWVKTLAEASPLLQSVTAIGPEGFPQDLPEGWLERRRGERVYISLDKDILSPQYARTDWSQGGMNLAALENLLGRVFASGVHVAALDICGELQEEKGACGEDLRINLETNMELYNFVKTCLNHYVRD